MVPHRVQLADVAALVAIAVAAFTPAFAQTPSVVDKATDWTTYAHGASSGKVCFAVSQPKEQEPKGARRDPAFIYVTAWPGTGVKGEVSIRVGYPLKKGSEPTITVGAEAFKLFAAEDRAFVDDPTLEQKLLDSMRKANTLVVKAQSARGVQTTDTYSLAGLTRALQVLDKSCSKP
jgi:hypothetical protein